MTDFRVGDKADHRGGGLDPRLVTRVEGDQIWIDVLGRVSGPLPAENYRRIPAVTEPDYEYDGVVMFEAPVFDVVVDVTGTTSPASVRLRLPSGDYELTDGVNGARRMAQVLNSAADWAEAQKQ